MSRIEPETLGRLFREHAPALLLYARQWCDAPEDLVQEAFLAMAGLRLPPERPAAWLHRVVRNRAIDLSRVGNRRRLRESASAASEAWFQTSDEDSIDSSTAAEALSVLEVDQREVIVARLWGGLTFEEVARLVDAPLTTVYRRYHSGLAELKNRLEGR